MPPLGWVIGQRGCVEDRTDRGLVPDRRGARQSRPRACPRGATATGPRRWCTARRTSTGSSPRSRRWSAGDHLFFTDWRGDPDERLRRDGPTVAELFGDGRRARRRGQGADVALAPGQAAVQRGGEPPPRRGHRGGRRRGAARPAGPPRRLAPPEAGRAAPPGPPATRRGVRRRHRPVPRPARRRRPPRRPAGGADVRPVRRPPALARRAAGAARPGGRRAGHGVPRALERPHPAGRGQPAGLAARPAQPRRPQGRPAARAARPAAAVRPARGAGAAHLPGDAAPVRLRAARRALGGPRLHQGGPPRPPADLPGGPVHVVGRRSPTCSPTRCGTTRTCTWSWWCRATPTSTAGSRCRPT